MLWCYPTLSTYYGLIIILVGTYYILSKPDPSGKYPLLFSSYIVGIEVLLRMTQSSLFWEFGKYSVIYFLLLGLMRNRDKIKLFTPIIFYFLFLLPSILLLPLNSFNLWRQAVAFNLSGPACLTICSIYLYNQKINKKNFKEILLCLLSPILSMALFNLLMMPDLGTYHFLPYSNPSTSGGYGPNQVSTIFGVGIVLLVIAQVLKINLFSSKYVIIFLLILFMGFGFITFSRGGIITAIISLSISISYYFFNGQKKAQFFLKTASILIISIIVWVAIVNITEGVIINRYGLDGGVYGEKFFLDLTGRAQIYDIDLKIFYDNIFTGVGPGQANELRAVYGYGSQVAAHIEYSRMLAEHGLTGLFSLIILFLAPIHQLLSEKLTSSRFLRLAFTIVAILTLSHSAMRLAITCFLYGLLFPKYID